MKEQKKESQHKRMCRKRALDIRYVYEVFDYHGYDRDWKENGLFYRKENAMAYLTEKGFVNCGIGLKEVLMMNGKPYTLPELSESQLELLFASSISKEDLEAVIVGGGTLTMKDSEEG
jgi:hypothetical protein